jgi:uncharacterized DUF497 family protein
VKYEWGENKRQDNLAKHGVDFASIEFFDWETAVHYQSNQHGEIRWAAQGMIDGRLHHVVYTERGENIRIISLRKANAREERRYAQTQ